MPDELKEIINEHINGNLSDMIKGIESFGEYDTASYLIIAVEQGYATHEEAFDILRKFIMYSK